MITRRWLDGVNATDEEWSKIDEILATRGWPSLNRPTSRIRLAEEDGKILSFLVVQLFPQVGPAWAAPSVRGTGIAAELADDMVQYLMDAQCRGWMVVADNPHAEKLARDRGMTRLESPVYVTGVS